MNRPELFYKSVNILQKAYFKGTLKHGDCRACAVGNLIAGNAGMENPICSLEWINKTGSDPNYNAGGCESWYAATPNGRYFAGMRVSIRQVELSGYDAYDLSEIERAFEGNKCDDNDGFEGLCAVIDTLMEIHEFNSEEKSSIPPKEKIFSKSELVLIEK